MARRCAQREIAGLARTEAGRDFLGAALAQCNHFLNELAVEFLAGIQPVGCRLGDIVGRAQRHGAQADGGISLGQRRRHDDAGVGIDFLQLGQGRQPVHHRHLDVEDDDVQRPLGSLDHRHFAIAAGGNKFDTRIGLQGAHDQAAHDGGIVHHHHAQMAGPGLSRVVAGSVMRVPPDRPAPACRAGRRGRTAS